MLAPGFKEIAETVEAYDTFIAALKDMTPEERSEYKQKYELHDIFGFDAVDELIQLLQYSRELLQVGFKDMTEEQQLEYLLQKK